MSFTIKNFSLNTTTNREAISDYLCKQIKKENILQSSIKECQLLSKVNNLKDEQKTSIVLKDNLETIKKLKNM